MNGHSPNPEIEYELEARIAALVLGEASDLERDQLERLIAERPELAGLKTHFEAIHGLLCDGMTGESIAADDDWKLPPEKRNALLAVIDGEALTQLDTSLASNSLRLGATATPVSIKHSALWKYSKIAAVLCVAGCLGVLAMSGSFLLYSMSASRPRQLALSEGVVLHKGDFSEASLDGEKVERKFRGGADVTFELPATEIAEGADAMVMNGLSSSPPAIGDEMGRELKLHAGILDRGLTEAKELSQRQLPAQVDQPASGELSYRDSVDSDNGLGTKNDSGIDGTNAWMFGGGFGGAGGMPNGGRGLNRSAGHSPGERYSQQTADFYGYSLPESAQPSRPMAPGNSDDNRSEGVEAFPARNYSAESSNGLPDELARGISPTSPSNRALFREGLLREDSKKQSDLADSNGASSAHLGDVAVAESVETEVLDLATINGRRGKGNVAAESDALAVLPTDMVGQDQTATLDVRMDTFFQPFFERRSELLKGGFALLPSASANLGENNAADEAFSTFSLHVSDVSFKLAQAALASGKWPEAAKLRIEEFVNAFDYGDPLPSLNEKVACRVEQSIHPFLQQRNVLRVSLRTAAMGRASDTPLRLTFLLDNSGSMERADRQQTVRRCFALLAQQLTPLDQVTLISFARQPRLLADKVSGDKAQQLIGLIEDLPSEGGTNIEAALQLAFEKAREQQSEGAQSRIILLTDGAVNLGDANPSSLSHLITTIRDSGIAVDAAGISADGLNDEILEALTRQGDGRYYLLDSTEVVDEGFARQIAGALRPSAKNVKVQIEFNPKRVGHYKLLGFEKHLLKQEDFRNDDVDAAEMAAAEAGVAVYQFEAKPDGEGDVGSVSVRFRDLATGQMVENRWPIPYEADAPRLDQAAPALRLATSAALLAAKLRGDPLGETVELKTLSDLIVSLPERVRKVARVEQLQQMIQQARQVSEK
ncbi:MAG: von Willebrand factor type A domain-containing protein [Planctomycetales bacterium]|nr:von Willebrand factor type A domain-containing protein [Planctomycetales bacterium]